MQLWSELPSPTSKYAVVLGIYAYQTPKHFVIFDNTYDLIFRCLLTFRLSTFSRNYFVTT